MILSAVLLMICSLPNVLSKNEREQLNPYLLVLKDVLYSGADIYIFYIFMLYFRFYKLKALHILTGIMLVTEFLTACIALPGPFVMIDLDQLRDTMNILNLLALLVWLFYLLPLKNENYVAIRSFYKYGLWIIITFLMALLIGLTLLYSSSLFAYNIQYLLLIIPYIFLIRIARQLYAPGDNSKPIY